MPPLKLWTGEEPPFFDWPGPYGQTWDAKNKRHVYPTSKNISEADNDVQRLCDIEKRVMAVLNAIDYDTGNIYRLIAEDLASTAAKDELALLPKTDYFSVQYADCISEECKDMLREKVKRYKRQYAHNLALEGMTDIALKWKCNEMGPQVYFLPADEMAYVNIAHKCTYKYTNWDFEHSQEFEEGFPVKRQPGECRKPVGAPPATHHGGFYACVISELVQSLNNLSSV